MTLEEMVALRDLQGAIPTTAQTHDVSEEEFQRLAVASQLERARQVAEDIAAQEQLARSISQPPISEGVRPKAALEYQKKTASNAPVKKETLAITKTSPGTLPNAVAMRTPEGRIVFTNRSDFGGEPLSQQASQAELIGNQTPEQAKGKFAIRPGQGSMSVASQVPTPSSYVNLDETQYQDLLSQQSPLIQDMMKERRQETRQGTVEALQTERLRKQMDPQFAAQMELAKRTALMKEAVEDPGVKLKVIQATNAWKQQNPQATPDQVDQVQKAIFAKMVQDYAVSQDPEMQLAQVKGFGLGM
jgi:hypothetical protein